MSKLKKKCPFCCTVLSSRFWGHCWLVLPRANTWLDSHRRATILPSCSSKLADIPFTTTELLLSTFSSHLAITVPRNVLTIILIDEGHKEWTVDMIQLWLCIISSEHERGNDQPTQETPQYWSSSFQRSRIISKFCHARRLLADPRTYIIIWRKDCSNYSHCVLWSKEI